MMIRNIRCCKDCKKRQLYCHASCVQYQKEKKDIDIRSASREKKKIYEDYVHDNYVRIQNILKHHDR